MKTILFKIDRGVLLYLISVSIIVLPLSVRACNVPVFRYALERWPANTYYVTVFYSGSLSSNDREVVEWLENSSAKVVPYWNFTVQTVDVTAPLSEEIRELWEHLEKPELPCMVVRYPGIMRMAPPVWSGRLSAEAAHTLVDSPLRQEIAGRILDGESVVWILIESGNDEKDDAAAALLETELQETVHLMELPNPDDFSPEEFVPIRETGPELRIAFSVVRLSRDDSAESMLVNMLMHSEPDLTDYASYPIAFPVYGRGRVLFALVGDGIEERNIREACMFATGPCSCMIKELNPGIDLLMKVDWDEGIGGGWVQDAILPPLVGFSELINDAATGKETEEDEDGNESATVALKNTTANRNSAASGTANTDSHTAKNESTVSAGEASDGTSVKHMYTSVEESSSHLLRNLLIALGIIFVITILLSISVLKPRKKDFI